MSVVRTFGDTLQRSRNKMQVHEKMCCLLGFTPNLYLTHNDRYFLVKLAARLEGEKYNRQIMTKVTKIHRFDSRPEGRDMQEQKFKIF